MAAGTPPEIVAKLNADIARVMKQPDVCDKLTGIGAEPVGNSREEFARFWKAEIDKYARLIKISGAVAE